MHRSPPEPTPTPPVTMEQDAASPPLAATQTPTAATTTTTTNESSHATVTTTIPSSTGPVGEPGLPPARPVSNATTTTTATAAPSRISVASRTVPPPLPQTPSGRRSYQSDASRPITSTSRTHAPNIISSAFLRSVSSKRAQQEQDTIPKSPLPEQLPIARPSTESGRRSHRHRNSNASIVTIDGQPTRPLVDPDAPPIPTSRGTDSAIPVPSTEVKPARNGPATFLQAPDLSKPLQLDPNPRSASIHRQRSPKSPRSLRGSWNRQSRTGRPNEPYPTRDGHLKLASTPTSPAHPPTNVFGFKLGNWGRNYEYYNGNAIFFLSGRLINARQRPLNVFTGLLAVLPAVLFFVFSAPWLWHNVSPAIPILFAYIFFICISSFLHASFTEPGILPRNLHPHAPQPPDSDPLAVGPPTTEWVTIRSHAPSMDGSSTAMEVPVKYCKSCNIWRPPRAHHCRVCDSCVETQDHHCVWLNNCVGRRNYRYFLTFVASGTALGCFLLGASLAHILVWMVRNNTSFGHAINVWRVPFAMFIYGIIIIPYPASLWVYHLFLMGRGETTREYLNSHKFQKQDRHRPFSQYSILKNWATVIVRPRPPTYMQFKSYYEPGDRRLGDKRGAEKVKAQQQQKKQQTTVEKNDGLEMKQMNGSSQGSARGFQGPTGRNPLNNINSTPRGDGSRAGTPKI